MRSVFVASDARSIGHCRSLSQKVDLLGSAIIRSEARTSPRIGINGFGRGTQFCGTQFYWDSSCRSIFRFWPLADIRESAFDVRIRG
jgi:hypothetical protein